MINPQEIDRFNLKLRKAFDLRGIDTSILTPDQGEILTDFAIDKGLIDTGTANLILEDITGVPFLDPTLATFQKSFIVHANNLIPKSVAIDERVFAVKHKADQIHLVMSIPTNLAAIKKLEYITSSRIKPYCCHTKGILSAIAQYYLDDNPDAYTADNENLETLAEKAVSAIHNLKALNADMEQIVNHVNVINMLKFVLNHLVKVDASDIHFEPQASNSRIRYRKDGVMQVLGVCPSAVGKALINRIKLISKMQFDSKNTPQDGSIDYHVVKDRDIDVRVSALPSLYGEKIVLRILAGDIGGLTLNELGMGVNESTSLKRVLERPSGMILVTGPTGSGKTTTLYAILRALNSEHVNILTAEDPIEYKIAGITQVNCDSETGLTFNKALRSFLRQDPDIIMVGEIRDRETAEMALKASMTGHLVLSTLHTNNAPGAINRLINMGIPPFLVASAQITVLAQRLVRVICEDCKTKDENVRIRLAQLNLNNTSGNYFIGKGCSLCSGTGYRGRTGIYELLLVNDDMVPIVLANEPSASLKKAAIAAGMTTLRNAALMKFENGVTTIEEVIRVTMD